MSVLTSQFSDPGGPQAAGTAPDPRTVGEVEIRTNATNAFIGKTTQPIRTEVASAFGPAVPVWKEPVNRLRDEQKITVGEWISSSPKYGWALRMKQKKRNIADMAPGDGCFRVSFILGDKAVAAARNGKLPKAVLKVLDEAPRYPEGTGLRLVVAKPGELAAIRTLIGVKLAN